MQDDDDVISSSDSFEADEDLGTNNYGTEMMMEDGEEDYDEEDALTIRNAVDEELANLTIGVGSSSLSGDDERANQTSNTPFSMTDKAEEMD